MRGGKERWHVGREKAFQARDRHQKAQDEKGSVFGIMTL